MQRQRGGLVPIGDALSGMGGPHEGAPRCLAPSAAGFTVADQVDRLVWASEAAPDRGFMARMMALCSLPRTNPRDRLRYVRRNGPYTLDTTGEPKGSRREPAGETRHLAKGCSVRIVRPKSPLFFRETVAGSEP